MRSFSQFALTRPAFVRRYWPSTDWAVYGLEFQNMENFFAIAPFILLAGLAYSLGRYIYRSGRRSGWFSSKTVGRAAAGTFPPPPDDAIWLAMQRALKYAAPYRPAPTTDVRLSDGDSALMSMELLEFLLSLEEALDMKIASEDLPDAALASLSGLYRHLALLETRKER